MTAKKSAPAGLGKAGASFWESVTAGWQMRPDELRLLDDCCREMDLIDRMEERVSKPSFEMTTRGSMGQRVANPLLGEIRQHRATLAAMLKQLKLTDAEGASDSDISAAARKAVNARWGRQRKSG